MKTQQCPSCQRYVPTYLQSQHKIRCLQKIGESIGQRLVQQILPTRKREVKQSSGIRSWTCPDCAKQIFQKNIQVHKIVCKKEITQTQESKIKRLEAQMVRMDALIEGILPIQKDYFDQFPGFQGECAICLSGMKDKPCIYLDCSHQFHALCIRKWLSKSGKCPLCRKRADQGI